MVWCTWVIGRSGGSGMMGGILRRNLYIRGFGRSSIKPQFGLLVIIARRRIFGECRRSILFGSSWCFQLFTFATSITLTMSFKRFNRLSVSIGRHIFTIILLISMFQHRWSINVRRHIAARRLLSGSYFGIEILWFMSIRIKGGWR